MVFPETKSAIEKSKGEAMQRAQTIVQSMAGIKVKVFTGKLFDLCRKKSYHGKFDKVLVRRVRVGGWGRGWRREERAHSLATAQAWRSYRTGFGKLD